MQTYYDADIAQEVTVGNNNNINRVAVGNNDVDREESATVIEEGSRIALSYTSIKLSASRILLS